MHRPTLGIIALMLLLAGVVGLNWPLESATHQQFANASLRVGVVLAVLWLALPQTRKLKSRTLLVSLLVAVTAATFRPKLIPLILVALVVVAVLRPRTRPTDSRTVK